MSIADTGASRRILFVDDESGILEGLRNRLRRRRNEWEMHFVLDGTAALKMLDAERFDIIVTDVRMPGMDGATLLKEAQARHPEVVRIVLSGHAELEAALRAVPVAHQFIAKPCDPGVLENVIERACQLQKLVNDGVVRGIVGKISGLPAMPRLYAQLRSMLADEQCSMHDVAALIAQDVGMSAKILQLVNSAFFRLSRPLTQIKEAIGYLGLDVVSRMALASELFELAPRSGDLARELASLRQHSLITAMISGKLLPDKKLQDDVFVAALLHDIGRLLLAVHLPEKYRAAKEHASHTGLEQYAAEIELFGVSHAEVGAYLLGIWGLPYFVIEAVANHHQPRRAHEPTFGILGAIHVGDALAHALTTGLEVRLDLEYLRQFGLADQWPEWKARFEDEVAEMASRLAVM